MFYLYRIMKTILFLFFAVCTAITVSSQEIDLQQTRQALQRACALKHPDSLATAYCHLGEYYAYRNSDSARYYFQLGLQQVRPANRELYCTLLVNEAETYFSNGQLDKAVEKFRFALQQAKRLQVEDKFQISILGSLGVVYRRQEMPDSALVCYSRALKILESLDEPDEKLYLLTNIAILYANTQRMEEAGYYIERAMQQADRCQDLDMVMYAGSSAGAIFANLQKNEQGLVYLRQVMHKGQREYKPRFVLKSMTYLLGQFQKLDMKDSVRVYLQQADALAASLPEANAEVQGFRETQYQLLTYLGRYRESLAVLHQLLEANVYNAQSSREELYYRMAKNYVALHEYASATACYEQARIEADSIKKVELDAQLSEWTVRYQTQEKEMEIVRLDQERAEQKARAWQWSILAVVLVFLLMSVLIYGFIRRRQHKKTEALRLAQRYIEGLERERARLAKDLHDGVCNDLLGVGMQLSILPPDEASRQEVLHLLEGIRQEVRSISHELMPPQFQHLTLLQAVEAYLERIQHSSTLKVNFHSEGEGAWEDLSQVVSYETYRILQEWLSNVWKYAGATQVDVCLALHADRFCLRIANDGRAFDSEQSQGGGIGLTTIQERVKSLGGHWSLSVVEGQQIFELTVSVLFRKS